MKFQTFDAIRPEKFAFKCDLNDFFEAIKAKTLPLFALKAFLLFQNNKKYWDRGLFPLFLLEFTQKLANHLF